MDPTPFQDHVRDVASPAAAGKASEPCGALEPGGQTGSRAAAHASLAGFAAEQSTFGADSVRVTPGCSIGGWESELGAALQDVSIPVGLAERLLSRLHEPGMGVAGTITAGTRMPAVRRHRRRWLRAAVGLACAASIAAAIVYLNQPTPELSGESVMELVRTFHERQPPARSLHREAAPADYPLGHFVVSRYVGGWFRLSSPLLGREGAAYQLLGPRQQHATLYVVDFVGPRRAPRLSLNATSPLENLLTTDGQTSAAWTDGARLYVLVVDGDEQAFRALVRAPRSMA
jgi:hypothetical protein